MAKYIGVRENEEDNYERLVDALSKQGYEYCRLTNRYEPKVSKRQAEVIAKGIVEAQRYAP